MRVMQIVISALFSITDNPYLPRIHSSDLRWFSYCTFAAHLLVITLKSYPWFCNHLEIRVEGIGPFTPVCFLILFVGQVGMWRWFLEMGIDRWSAWNLVHAHLHDGRAGGIASYDDWEVVDQLWHHYAQALGQPTVRILEMKFQPSFVIHSMTGNLQIQFFTGNAQGKLSSLRATPVLYGLRLKSPILTGKSSPLRANT